MHERSPPQVVQEIVDMQGGGSWHIAHVLATNSGATSGKQLTNKDSQQKTADAVHSRMCLFHSKHTPSCISQSDASADILLWQQLTAMMTLCWAATSLSVSVHLELPWNSLALCNKCTIREGFQCCWKYYYPSLKWYVSHRLKECEIVLCVPGRLNFVALKDVSEEILQWNCNDFNNLVINKHLWYILTFKKMVLWYCIL